MKPDPISLSQSDKLKALSHYYSLSSVQTLDWAIKVLWERRVREDIGLLTLLEISESPEIRKLSSPIIDNPPLDP